MPSRNPLEHRRVALGVTGSIAAYKAVGIASVLTQQGALVDVVMTPEAIRLVQALSFEAITHRPACADMFELDADGGIRHVTVGRAAEVFVVAPATAHSIAKLALGLADDMVSATALSCAAPGVLAPAMETNMWQHPATRDHVRILRERGWTIVEPEVGHLASGAVGEGRLADPEAIVGAVKQVLGRAGDLAGWRVAVTAGGTREPLDPVRYLSNRSSGKMGYAVAESARDRGATVTLITSAALPQPFGVKAVAVDQAAQMRDAVMSVLPEVDALVMAAAVADYRPIAAAGQKIKKHAERLSLDLTLTSDILDEVMESKVDGRRPLVVGFAAETADLVANARKKLQGKRLDLVVANDVSLEGSGFDSDFNKVVMLRRDGSETELPLLPKMDVAHRLWDEALALRAGST
jgi:phosphopantothenoylcysteine decarboxylase/phosphopantothenate--cysteine ligase